MNDEGVKQTAHLIYQTALMESGFMLSDPKDFASRIYSSVKSSLNISPDATVEEEDEVEEVEADTDAKTSTESPNYEAESAQDEEEIATALWWNPSKLQHHFSKQGVRGPPYQFFLGNVKDLAALMSQASAQPLPLFSHNILPRVLPFYHHWKKIYGTPTKS